MDRWTLLALGCLPCGHAGISLKARATGVTQLGSGADFLGDRCGVRLRSVRRVATKF
jgi:hypothetical protein